MIEFYLKAPDPSTIRSLSILEQAFPFVLNKYKSNNDWSYISSQLKSIRQDLMVQSIRNDFTVLVYEENARIALEMVIKKKRGMFVFVKICSFFRVIEISLFNVKHN